MRTRDGSRAILDHQFVVIAAYAITWAIQLGYLAWLGLNMGVRNSATRDLRAAPRANAAVIRIDTL